MDAGVTLGVLLVAGAVDRWLGEPPARWHPVVGMGTYLGWAGRCIAPRVDGPGAPGWVPDQRAAGAPGARGAHPVARRGPVRCFAWGALAWAAGAVAVVALGVAGERLLAAAPGWLAVGLGALLFKPLFAWRMLQEETAAVEAALASSLDAGRDRLARLVSRDVASLDAAGVRESAIESLAENLNDSVVAPVFWFLVGGLPAAALYRFANTADAMWGYPGPRGGRDWAWAGKFAARADDVLSWLPARITAGLLVLGGSWRGAHGLGAQARRTPSPNSGWPMAAMALALDVRLGKPGVYTLNPAGRIPAPGDAARAQRFAARAVALGLMLAVVVLALRGVAA